MTSDEAIITANIFSAINSYLKLIRRQIEASKYHPSKDGVAEYYNQSYKVVGRVKSGTELQPQWNIMFEDGKIITARADEVISSAINERLYGRQFEEFSAKPLSGVQISVDNEKMSL